MDDDELRLVAELAISADAEMLTVCRMVLAGVVADRGLPDDVLDDAKLVLSELCADAIDHASRSDTGVEVAFRTSLTEVEVTVTDRRPDAVAAPPGGEIGLRLLRQLCARLEVITGADGQGTIVRFAYALPA
jgi:anti-sigma regulatory factor (Ser/Thr protein kinase)